MLQAPAIPDGSHLAYWDSGAEGTHLAGARGMEVQQHLHSPVTAEPSRVCSHPRRDRGVDKQDSSCSLLAAADARNSNTTRMLDPSWASLSTCQCVIEQVYNHWGPVDADAARPAERLAELLGARASYYRPPVPGQVPTSMPKDLHMEHNGWVNQVQSL